MNQNLPNTQNGQQTSSAPQSTTSDAPQQEQSSFATPPAIQLPTGGGAIRGIDEKFQVNPATGSGAMSVPIATSPGRNGFGPQMALSYDSGAGNGPFGLGWNLSIPNITRKTDKGLPRYWDGDESDIYILSGAEDLVPEFKKDERGNWVMENGQHVIFDEPEPREVNGTKYQVRRYRPRIEGLFSRIERWTNLTDGTIHWRSITRDNVTSLYGKTDKSRIVDPTDKSRIFSWLLCESYDDKGNAVLYEYKAEDSAGVDVTQAHERNRTDEQRATNRYLKRIKYGNRTPRLPNEDLLLRTDWMFEVVLDYGEGHLTNLSANPPDPTTHQLVAATLDEANDWPARQDPFSSYRAGFEVRTYRLCRRVLMFHHFSDELGLDDYLVRSTEFNYDEGPILTYLTAAIQSGDMRREESDQFICRSLPPVEFEYSQVPLQDSVQPDDVDELHRLRVQEIDSDNLENLPIGLSGPYQFVDLDGEGLSGILTEQADAWYYKPNLGDGNFGPLRTVAQQPSLAALGSGQQQLLDLAGDGQLDLAMFNSPTPGFYERTQERNWTPFQNFVTLPNVDWGDPNLRFVDLTGDGRADLLMTEENIFTWYPSLAEAGFGASEFVRQPWDEEAGPRLILNDVNQSIFLSDMSGDGLTDLVRIRNGEICYWPSLGYGRFGAKVTMDNAPWFDTPDLFDQRRLRLADVDGSGITDILYLGREGVHIFYNQAGNSWSGADRLPLFPQIDNMIDVQVTDLLGNGTACLVWSSPLPGDSGRQLRYVDLMNSTKPHLMIRSKNNLGAETVVAYAPSTKFYLADQAAGTPWITRQPFPIHVVERTETVDRISRNRFVSRYSYHHGYFDGEEREFRGFGRVEQLDTETFEALTDGEGDTPSENIAAASHIPPVMTKSWYHTGAYIDGQRISRLFEDEYYREPRFRPADDATDANRNELDEQFRAQLLPDTVLPNTVLPDDMLSAHAEREAVRALKGSMLRQEVYALDGSDKEDDPYVVTEQNFTIEPVQPHGPNPYTVFFTHPRETIAYNYERNPEDPRVTHNAVLEVDEVGNVKRAVAIGYGRRIDDLELDNTDQAKQAKTLLTFTETDYTNGIDTGGIDEVDAYRTPAVSQNRSYELTGLTLADETERYTFAELDEVTEEATQQAVFLNYHDKPTTNEIKKRLLEHVRTFYRPDDLGVAAGSTEELLPLGKLESLALPGESYQLALTQDHVDKIYGDRVIDADGDRVIDADFVEGGYVHTADEGGQLDNSWWIPSGRVFLSPEVDDTLSDLAKAQAELAYAEDHFYMPLCFRDPFGHTTKMSYDSHDLLVESSSDPVQNQMTVQNDYRVLQPHTLTDPNGNQSQAAFDALGMVAGTAAIGKDGEGDSLDGFQEQLTQTQIDAFYADPRGQVAHDLLGSATSRIVYDETRFLRLGEENPPFAATIVRETHVGELPAGEETKLQVSIAYSDGFGRVIQSKVQAEPERDDAGLPIDEPRWIGSGWTIFNNKGSPVRQYEPFFSDLPPNERHHFEFNRQEGVSPVIFYDPVGRAIGTLHPNHTWEKVLFDPWRQETWDVNDTMLIDDPKNDLDVGDYFARLADDAYLPTWHTKMSAAESSPAEQIAASKSEIHAATPTVAYFDSLGRPVLTIAHNKYLDQNEAVVEEEFKTRTNLDIEGATLAVIDAKDREVMIYAVRATQPGGNVLETIGYDVAGNQLYQLSMEAGERLALNDIAGQPLRAWDNRGHFFRTEYDALRRPLRSFVTGAVPDDLDQEILVDRMVYGEQHPQAEALNLRGTAYLVLDQAGAVTNEANDFKGNPLSGTRRLAREYKQVVEWQTVDDVLPADPTDEFDAATLEAAIVPLVEDETFRSRTRYDALNRPTQSIAPHSDQFGTTVNVTQPIYNEANLLDGIDVWLNQPTQPNGLIDDSVTSPSSLVGVTNIDYNAKGQRLQIAYKNGTTTSYEYDDKTFRLQSMQTSRSSNGDLQNLSYTYDPVGNITRIADDAQQTIFFSNRRVEPSNDYKYDAVYRLIEAKGREHLGQTNGPTPPNAFNDFHIHLDHPGDGDAMGPYTEVYVYDEVGNSETMEHRGSDPVDFWTRTYAYDEPSLIDPTKVSNRLSSTTLSGTGSGTEVYTYDAHGNMADMPHLTLMQWDYRDQLQATSKQVFNNGTPEITYYVYDASGERVRKITERQAPAGQEPTRKDERIYLGGLEIYRKYENDGAAPLTLERETLHVMDDQQRIALVETRTDVPGREPLIRYQLGNHLGSVSLEIDAQAQVISYEEYFPYGSTSYQAGRSQAEVKRKQYRYTGMERDEESGLSYHSARYYLPWLGRWANSDPIGILDGVNTYQYGSNNSVNRIDPSGTEDRPPIWEAKIGVKFTIGTATSVEVSPYAQLTASIPSPDSNFAVDVGIRLDLYTAARKYDVDRGALGGILTGYLGGGFSDGSGPNVQFRTNSFDVRTFSGSGKSWSNFRLGYGITQWLGHYPKVEGLNQPSLESSPLFSRTGNIYIGGGGDNWSFNANYGNDNMPGGNKLDANETAFVNLQLQIGDFSGEVGFFNVTDQIRHGSVDQLDPKYKRLDSPAGAGVRLVEGEFHDIERKLATYQTQGPGVKQHIAYVAASWKGFQLRVGGDGKWVYDWTQGKAHDTLGYHNFPHRKTTDLYFEAIADASTTSQ